MAHGGSASSLKDRSVSSNYADLRKSPMDEKKKPIKIVCISDTHNGHKVQQFADKIQKLDGDILIHAGDFSEDGKEEIMDAFDWLCSLNNFTFKIFISGNMDGFVLDDGSPNGGYRKREELFKNDNNVIYLENECRTILGINIYGCPYTPKFVGGFAYNRGSTEAKQLWKMIPNDCDILISHGPPADILDATSRGMI
ncbi:unnamed protein product [Didymodactylos carnosus]|uniref:Calcineurin-like phosphoesterase domain-containing protein n=1 Tax=Didymodactylos carnosus TaxID=1234261 RepID=A0A815HAQ1_9BILA|nr:unnamed protein product [Didymodactylos carnosus]CAF1349004.1 unnamed protein product [Didymodactylos carnosus]CAF4105465.1 unnamed protein product [Didymodactylos carnosus]CAF4217205.1 unnamed protein product [Didymodactylos carnosus]